MRHVLDLSRLLPGPWASTRLLEAGMRVTKVELPHFPDPLAAHPLNSGKKRLLLDFRKPEGRKKLEALIKKADVLLESFRPDTLEEMGLTWPRLRKLRPKLVYCSISGWKEGGRAGHDLNILAATGWLDLSPALPATQVADLAAGEDAAVKILAALLKGGPARLKVSMEEAMWRWYPLPRIFDGDPFYRLYEARDGKVAVAAVEPRFKSALLAHLRLQDAAELAQAIAKTSVADWEGTDFCVSAVRTWETASRGAGGSRTRPRRSPAKAPTKG